MSAKFIPATSARGAECRPFVISLGDSPVCAIFCAATGPVFRLSKSKLAIRPPIPGDSAQMRERRKRPNCAARRDIAVTAPRRFAAQLSHPDSPHESPSRPGVVAGLRSETRSRLFRIFPQLQLDVEVAPISGIDVARICRLNEGRPRASAPSDESSAFGS